jgi:hypothetical protein
MDNAQKPAITIQSALICSPRDSPITATAQVPKAATPIHSSFFHTLMPRKLN